MGYGKTVLVSWIAEMIIDHYGADQVNSIRNRGADLRALMDNMDEKPVQILFLDDSYGKMNKDIAKEFTLIRHQFGDVRAAAGEPKSGVIIAMFGIQDLFTLDKLARRVGSCVIGKSSSADKYYRTELKKNFGSRGLEELDRITNKVLNEYDHEAKGTSVITITGASETGILRSEMVDEDPFRDVERVSEVISPRVSKEEFEGLEVEWTQERSIQDLELLLEIYKAVPDALQDLSTNKYQPHHAEAWKMYYYEGYTQDHLASEFQRSKGVFSNDYGNGGWFAVFSKEVIGYACEIALQRRYFPDLQVYGKNNPEAPDLYNPDSGVMVEVKMRKRREPPSLSMFSGSELKGIQAGEPVKLALVTYDKQKCSLEVWAPRALPNPSPLVDVGHLGAAGGVVQDSGFDLSRPGMGIGQMEKFKQLEEGLNPLAIPAAQDLLKKTMEAAAAAVVEVGGDPKEILRMSLEHTLEELEKVSSSNPGRYEPEFLEAIREYLTRYRNCI